MSFKRSVLALTFALGLAACAQPETTSTAPPVTTRPPAASAPAASATAALEQVIVDGANGPVTIEVEIADDEAERNQGLMFRESMPPNHGMLFEFQEPRPVTFWMHNTVLSLDIIFIGMNGRVLNIADHAPTLSDAPIPSAGVVRGVLELNAGRAAQLGIRPGDRVHHRIFPAG